MQNKISLKKSKHTTISRQQLSVDAANIEQKNHTE